MLTVEIKLNGRLVAGAKVENITSLAEVSDYRVEAVEAASDVTGLPNAHLVFEVAGHQRRQSVWALVRQVAAKAAFVQSRKLAALDGRAPEAL